MHKACRGQYTVKLLQQRPFERPSLRGHAVVARHALRSQMAKEGALVWFRRDLRLTDHEPLLHASKSSTAMVPFYCLDPGLLRAEAPGELPMIGPYRARFLLEALHSLDRGLRTHGSALKFSLDRTSDIMATLVQQLSGSCGSVTLYYHLDYGGKAKAEADAVDAAFNGAAEQAGINADICRCWDRTLVHPDDLPQTWLAETSLHRNVAVSLGTVAKRLAGAPSIMTDFRKAVEAQCPVRPPLAAPHVLPAAPAEFGPCTAIPENLDQLYRAASAETAAQRIAEVTGIVPGKQSSSSSMFPLRGGEAEAAERLNHFLGSSDTDENASTAANTALDWNSRSNCPLAGYKEARMLATGLDNSAKLSAYLNLGCITPCQIHAALEAMQGSEQALDGRKWLTMHLQIRDYFQYSFLREDGSRSLPHWEGHPQAELQAIDETEAFGRWCQGRTGFPFVDASMRELATTGYMSNRSRQNVASILTKGMGIGWRRGESLFRCLLIDYDPAANVGNWKYVSGVGSDPRGAVRVFRTVSQGMKYDEEAMLIRTWVPELSELPINQMHTPWVCKGVALKYPSPILDPHTQLRREHQ